MSNSFRHGMKNVLLDEPVAEDLRHHLLPHTVETVGYRGLKGTTNGELLRIAEAAGFDILLTSDKNIPHQNNISVFRIAVIVVYSNVLEHLLPSIDPIRDAIERIQPGQVVYVVP